jgi:hypothetical protein
MNRGYVELGSHRKRVTNPLLIPYLAIPRLLYATYSATACFVLSNVCEYRDITTGKAVRADKYRYRNDKAPSSTIGFA